MGVGLDPAVLLQLGLPCGKSHRCSARPSPRTIPAWLGAAGSLTGLGPGLGRLSAVSSAHTYPGPSTACKLLPTRDVNPWLGHSLSPCHHIPLVTLQQDAWLFLIPLCLLPLFSPPFPYPMSSPSFLPFPSTLPLTKY